MDTSAEVTEILDVAVGEYACKKESMSLCNPGLMIGNDILSFPLLDWNQSSLFKRGVHNEIILDKSKFSIQNKHWKDKVQEEYDLDIYNLNCGPIEINFNDPKLLILPKGSSFQYKARNPSNDKAGMLMIGLPTKYTGGNVNCFDKDSKSLFKVSKPKHIYDYDYFGFLSELNFEIKEIKSGVRIFILYNLTNSLHLPIRLNDDIIDRLPKILLENKDCITYPGEGNYTWYKLQNISRTAVKLIKFFLLANEQYNSSSKVEVWMTNGSLKLIKCSLSFNTVHCEETKLVVDNYPKYTVIIIKQTEVLKFLWDNCSEDDYFSYINNHNDIPLKLLYKNLLQIIPEMDNPLTCEQIYVRFLKDTQMFLNILKVLDIQSDDRHDFVSFMEKYGGISYDASLEYNSIQYSFYHKIFCNLNEEKLLIFKSDPKWKRFCDCISNPHPTMLELPNGILVLCDLTFSVMNKQECIKYRVKRVFYHPEFLKIQQTILDVITPLELPIGSLDRLFSKYEWIANSDVTFSLSWEDFSNSDIMAFTTFACEKYWEKYSPQLKKILVTQDFPIIMKILFDLYTAGDEYQHLCANECFPILIKNIEDKNQIENFNSKPIEDYISNIAYLYILSHYSDSFELVDIAEEYELLNVIVSQNLPVTDEEIKLSTITIEDFEKWHRIFVVRRRDELIEFITKSETKERLEELHKESIEFKKENKIFTGLKSFRGEDKETWIKENINEKIQEYLSVNTGMIIVFEIDYQKRIETLQKNEEDLTKLKEMYPFLYLGKRAREISTVREPKRKKCL